MQKYVFPILVFSIAFISACDSNKAPTGQVVARVNGEEITVAELNHEASERGIRNANEPRIMSQLLQSIVDRKLVAQGAVERELDRSPEYLVMKERAEELMLANLFLRKALGGGANQQPSTQAIETFAKENPTLFDERVIFTVDQIAFARPSDPQLIRDITAAQALSEIEERLAAAGVQRERANANVDSAQLPADVVKQLKALSPGEPYVQIGGNPMVAGVVVAARPAPLPSQVRTAIASQALEQKRLRDGMQSWLSGSRRSASIQYQKGYEPQPQSGASKSAGK